MCQDENNIWHLVGVMLYPGCDANVNNSVYVRVSKFIDFIYEGVTSEGKWYFLQDFRLPWSTFRPFFLGGGSCTRNGKLKIFRLFGYFPGGGGVISMQWHLTNGKIWYANGSCKVTAVSSWEIKVRKLWKVNKPEQTQRCVVVFIIWWYWIDWFFLKLRIYCTCQINI